MISALCGSSSTSITTSPLLNTASLTWLTVKLRLLAQAACGQGFCLLPTGTVAAWARRLGTLQSDVELRRGLCIKPPHICIGVVL